jgi:hypothetical protein
MSDQPNARPQGPVHVSTLSELQVVNLKDLNVPLEDSTDELIKKRFLCRNGAFLFVGGTGTGKSTLLMHVMISFACGEPAFGLIPNGKLRILLVQAENDEGDLVEMRNGALLGLDIERSRIDEGLGRIFVCSENQRTGRDFTRHVLRPLLEAIKPDLLVIDPALAYLGGEMNSQEAVSEFTRGCLSPLLKEFKCGLIMIHHTNKTQNQSLVNAAYLGAGSAEWANWSRAIATLVPGKDGIFKLSLVKRGARAGWKEADGKTPAFDKFLEQSQEEGKLYWIEVDPPETRSYITPKRSELKALLIDLVPLNGSISKNELVAKSKTKGIGEAKAKTLIKELVTEGLLVQSKRFRSGTRDEILLERPATLEGLP